MISSPAAISAYPAEENSHETAMEMAATSAELGAQADSPSWDLKCSISGAQSGPIAYPDCSRMTEESMLSYPLAVAGFTGKFDKLFVNHVFFRARCNLLVIVINHAQKGTLA